MDFSAIEEIPFEQAIAIPLHACNEVQSKVMQRSYELLDACFQKREGKPALPVYEKFCMLQEDGKTGQQLRIPRLSMLPIPIMMVENLNVDFQARVTAISKEKLNVRMLNEQTESSHSETVYCYLGVRLNAGVSDMPAGLAKFYQLCSDEMTTVEAEVD